MIAGKLGLALALRSDADARAQSAVTDAIRAAVKSRLGGPQVYALGLGLEITAARGAKPRASRASAKSEPSTCADSSSGESSFPAASIPRSSSRSDAAELTDLELRDRMLLRERTAWLEFHRRFDRLVARCIHKVALRFRRRIGEGDVREVHAQFLFDLTSRDMHRLRAYSAVKQWLGKH